MKLPISPRRVGANVQEVARGIGLDNRIGQRFLHAGPGFGGSCFPKDTKALIKTAQDNNAPLRIVETVVAVNDQRKRAMARKVANAFGGNGNLRGKTIAVLGLTFKPNTDDMRDAPSIPLITALQDMGAKIRVFDPVGMPQAKKVIENVTFCKDVHDCARAAHAIVIVSEWEQFRALDFRELATVMASLVIVDLRNIYSPEEAEWISLLRSRPAQAARLLADGRIDACDQRKFGADCSGDRRRRLDPARNRARLDILGNNPGFTFRKLDLADRDAIG